MTVDVDGYPTVCNVCGRRLLKTGSEPVTYLTDVATGVKTGRHSRCEADG